MPFTFSHPAIVLPLALLPKKWFSLTGLIIGSLTPDFEYFLRMKIQSDYSHTLAGILWFDLPLGILLAFIFHNLVRNPFFNNLPLFLKSRFLEFTHFNWNEYFKMHKWLVVLSILIGAASHLFWDSFTHPYGYFVETIPALTQPVTILGFSIPFLKMLQHASTLFGGTIILWVIFKLPANNNITAHFNIQYWGIFATLTFSIIAIRLLSGLDYHLYGHLIATIISAVIVALITTPFLTKKIKHHGSKIRI